MRLAEIRRRRRDEAAPLPADVARELEALDAILAGEEPPGGGEALAALARELRAERAEPAPDFAAELDRWAAAGFPRRERPGRGAKRRPAGAQGRLRSLAGALTARRLAPVGAALATLVVVVVAATQVDFGARGPDGATEPLVAEDAEVAAPTQPDAAPGQAGVDVEGVPEAPTARESSRGLERLPGALSGDARRAALPFNDRGPAGGQDVRRVERDAQLTLAAPADEVQEVTNEAIAVTERHRGIVLSSRATTSGDVARATLDLVIPSRTLDQALDELRELADVRSFSEGSLDITRPFVDAKDRLAGLRAERKSLLAQIRAAGTEEELDRLRLRLDRVEDEIAQANAEFERIQRRARHARVSLQITSEGASAGDWSLGDALDDAGRVLTVAAGIALVAGAVLLPLALVAAIAYALLAAGRRRARERALDE